jgi:aspartate aminotransferase
VASALAEETGLAYGPEHVMMTVGAGGGINAVLHALCESGDEVVIFAPYFAEYLFYAVNHGAKSVAVGCGSNFTPDLIELESKITLRTKVVMVNSPNNPSGRVYPGTFIRELGELLQRKGQELGTEIYLLSDEPYRKIIFDDQPYPFPQLAYDKTITVTSHSKDLALAGERIGYVAVHPGYDGGAELMDAFVFCNRVLGFVNAPAMMQHVVRALQHVTVDVGDYQKKRDYLYGVLTEAGYRVFRPEGAFYMFPESPVEDEILLVEALQRHGVLVVPGRGFGMPGYFRISYCVDQRVLEGAAPGFRAVARELGATG